MRTINFSTDILKQEKKDLGLPYLKLQINAETQIALPMEHTQEVLTVDVGRITPIPNMAKNIIGLINQRNKVFWVADLSLMLGLSSVTQEKQQYNVAIIRVENVPLGLVIEEIKGVIRIPENMIQSPVGVVSPHLTSYLRGCFMSTEGMLLILDPNSIINN